MDNLNDSVTILEETLEAIRLIAAAESAELSDTVNKILEDYLLSYEYSKALNYFDVIHSIEKNLTENNFLVIKDSPSDFTISAKSSLQYIYRPTLKYKFDIIRDSDRYIGEMQAVVRSNNIDLLKCFSEFTELWMSLEAKYLRFRDVDRIEYITDSGLFDRRIYLPAETDSRDAAVNGAAIGEAVGSYIDVFDRLFKFCFNNPGLTAGDIEAMYQSYLNSGKLTV